ncbi:hypothetical protein GCM10007096_35130 [Pullulanibacillus pueri]|uniref:Malic enzyme N-terminal domain-containing protein n=1 Tax=Pullulanibacillus pueri TaxID=1437324 RepID=A0A8J3ENJ4_9BACL|nr:hypothetical protein GCM10007096_35130 [Pullulanibacillus pueri]
MSRNLVKKFTIIKRGISIHTMKANTVAVVTNGTAVLGLEDLGPKAARSVMEGKAVLFKSFAGVDVFPICLYSTDNEKIIHTVKALAFGRHWMSMRHILMKI